MLTSHDTYEINAQYAMDAIHHRSIQLLYQPLLGHKAVSVYLYLWSEVSQFVLTKAPCYHKRMSKIVGMSLSGLQESLRRLEGIGLLNTYQKQEGMYVYALVLPLSPDAFFKHPILNGLLLQILGKEEHQRTQCCFKTHQVDTTTYANITASFQEVFTIALDGQTTKPLLDAQFMDTKTNAIEKDYPLTLFYAGLQDYQIKKDSITKADETLIQQLGTMYKIDALTMQGLVKRALQEDVLQHNVLTKECRAYYQLQEPTKFTNVYHKQSIKHKSVKTNTSIDQHVQYLETITPYRLLQDKQGGKEPTRKDVVIVESIMTTLGLEPGVMNVLVEMTLKECDNSLPRGYMEHYGGQWKRKKITTVLEAIKEAKQNMKKKDKNRVVMPSLQDKKYEEVDENTIDTETLKQMLAEFD